MYTTLLFDFDYTLADSSRPCAECINFALQQMGFPAVPFETACQTIGLSLPDTFEKLVGLKDPQQKADFARLFIVKAEEVMVAWTRLMGPVPGLLPALKQRGMRLGIVSTKYRHRMISILDREKLTAYFDIIIGAEDVKRFKPHPEGIQKALNFLDAGPAGALYIGDSVTDARTAANAGLDFVAVLSGTTTAEEFQDFKPLTILPHLGELVEWLGNGGRRLQKERDGL